MNAIRVGFLHLGRERSGLRRYGAILAAEAATRPDVEVVAREDRSARKREHPELIAIGGGETTSLFVEPEWTNDASIAIPETSNVPGRCG